jgi:hypothetical protein
MERLQVFQEVLLPTAEEVAGLVQILQAQGVLAVAGQVLSHLQQA